MPFNLFINLPQYVIELNYVMFFDHLFFAAVRDGTPSYNELSRLAHEIPSEWKNLGGLLGISNARITAFERQNQYDIFEQAYKMLQHWKQSKARRATYKVLFDALSDELVDRGDLAVKYCCKKK